MDCHSDFQTRFVPSDFWCLEGDKEGPFKYLTFDPREGNDARTLSTCQKVSALLKNTFRILPKRRIALQPVQVVPKEFATNVRLS